MRLARAVVQRGAGMKYCRVSIDHTTRGGVYKKDFEPYQSMGPLCGIFDQRAAEKLNHHADCLGFDAISVGGTLAWLMDCLDDGLITPAELGVDRASRWEPANFDVVGDSMHNAELGTALLDQMAIITVKYVNTIY